MSNALISSLWTFIVCTALLFATLTAILAVKVYYYGQRFYNEGGSKQNREVVDLAKMNSMKRRERFQEDEVIDLDKMSSPE